MEKSRDLLRFTTTGSVDDGKSTLIGRLLYETHSIFEDQLLSIEKTSLKRGQDEADLSLLLDGLAAERDQGITIDVAYRYFSTAKRKFIIADTPGHEQYTRNMVTGASHAQLALILIDARKGVLPQSRRHGFLLSLLQVPHLIVAINKMDLVDYSETIYEGIVKEYTLFLEKLDIHDVSFIPVSALKGDNITVRSPHMPWFQGPTLLHQLEHVEIRADRNLIDFRYPVQLVLRPNQYFRGYAGKIASGLIRRGEEIAVLPSGKTSRIRSIETFDGPLNEASAGESVVLTLEDELDISRGALLVRPKNLPESSSQLDTMLSWLDEAPGEMGKYYELKLGTKMVKAWISEIHYQIDIHTINRVPCTQLNLNETGRVTIQTAQTLAFDDYRRNRATGSFILIDPDSCHTVAAGMIRGAVRKIENLLPSRKVTMLPMPHLSRPQGEISRTEREKRNGHKAMVIWLTGLSGSGKSTLAKALALDLFHRGCQVSNLDGDLLRQGLCRDLAFSAEDRSENIRRAGEVAKLFFEQGNLVICSFISPFRIDRQYVRDLLPEGRFLEVYVECDLEVCKHRDPKGLYQKAEAGKISDFTGVSSPYEAPLNPEIHLNTTQMNETACLEKLITALIEQEILHPPGITDV